jgi:puromycin-sensitive aminopeptidase
LLTSDGVFAIGIKKAYTGFMKNTKIAKKLSKKSTKSVRLTHTVVPIQYDIRIKPDLTNFTFEGIETIRISILEKTNAITLHSKELEIETAEISIGKEKVFAKKIAYDEKKETITFTFPQMIPVGNIKLTLVFAGILNDNMRGFYKSSYVVDGKTKHLATTQFEATDARRAFPCFDEPAHKAVFHVSLIVSKGQTAISNTLPVNVSEHSVGYDLIRFSPTPKMSTYLLAYIVGEFEYIKGTTKNGTLVRVFTTPGKLHQAVFALDCSIRTLEFYEDYFAIKYPLPVLDMIAIPDFSAGAMENWGAVTYRESMLLIDEKNSSIVSRQWVALVIAHELAHQWFGNLVTMEWWTHLWLNEGFASYIEYLAIDKLYPQWDIWTQFLAHDFNTGLKLDGLKHTHPIEVEVHHPDEISEIFDAVSYSKGASVIRMLAGYLGEKDFRDGLRYYLKKYSYKNTETVDLWHAFEHVSRKSVAHMMHGWTSNAGYPVVSVSEKNSVLSLSQHRFYSNPRSRAKTKETVWSIPIQLQNKKDTNTILFSSAKTTVKVSSLPVKINSGEISFFRTAYSRELLSQLYDQVQNKILPPVDRLGIIRDLFALSLSGDSATTDLFTFLPAYSTEDNYVVWLEIIGGLSKIESLLAHTKNTEQLHRYIRTLCEPLYLKLGHEKKKGENHFDTLLRPLIFSRLGRSGHGGVIAQAKKYFALIKKGIHVDPDIRGPVYSIVASVGGRTEYNALIALYKKETLHQEKNRIGMSLGNFSDATILKDVCEFAFSAHVRTQDTIGILSSVGSSHSGRTVWFSFVKKEWKTILSRYGSGGHTISSLVTAVSNSGDIKVLTQFKKFFATQKVPGADRAVKQVIENIEANILWFDRDSASVLKLLKS